MATAKHKKSLFENPVLSTKIKSVNVKGPEALIGYLIGPFGALLASGIFTNYLNRYWTEVLFANYKDASGVMASNINTFLTILPMLSAILIVAGNLFVGQLIERTKTRAGKARPWLLCSSLLLAVGCIVMFVAPMGNGTDTPVLTMVFTAVAYNVYYAVAYPMYNTANSVLIPVSTRNSSQRGLLASLTNFATIGVTGAGGMIFPFIVSYVIGYQSTGWTITFIIVGVVSCLFAVLQYYFTRERVTEESFHLATETTKKQSVPIGKQFRTVGTDLFWWIIIIGYLIFQFSGTLKNVSITYFASNQFSDFIDGDTATSIINILGAVPMAAAMAFIWPLSHKFGKRIVVLVGLVVGALGGLLAGIWSDNFYVVCVGVAIKSLGMAPMSYMILAMISDVLDHLEAKHGFRCDGLTMSLYSAIHAAATPLAQGLFNAITTSGSNATMVTVSYIWFDFVVYIVCAVMLVFFTVEKYLPEDRKKIRERQKAEAIAAGIEWIEPEERLRLEEAEAARLSEEARIAELKARCEKKGLSFDEEEAKYQEKLRIKQEKKAQKKADKQK